jgi:hypothetical protein
MISIAVAFLPLALYFFALAAINSGRRPRMLTGQEDLTAIALGLIGFVMVGPLLYILPIDALAFWGFYTWFFLALLYALVVWFLGAVFRFRVVVYNINAGELKSILEKVGQELDSEARWAGNSLSLPTLGIQFYMTRFSLLRNTSLQSCGPDQDLQGWLRFEKSLHNTLMQHHSEKNNRVPIFMTTIGFVMAATSATILLTYSTEAFAALRFLLQ